MAAAAPTVGWIGTGRMGYQLALRLLNAGYDLAAYNRTRAKAEPLAGHGAKIADSPAGLAGRDVVFIMVAADQDLENVVSGPGGCCRAVWCRGWWLTPRRSRRRGRRGSGPWWRGRGRGSWRRR